MSKIESTGEAFAYLDQTYPTRIAVARAIARHMAFQNHGKAISHRVVAEMVRLGFATAKEKKFWAGRIFEEKDWIKLEERESHSQFGANERTNPWWLIREIQ